MVPAGGEAFVLDAELLGAIQLEQIEGDVVKDRQVFWCVTGTDAGLVLVHGDIQDPVETVFDRPVAAHDPGEGRSIRGQARLMRGATLRSCWQALSEVGGRASSLVPDGCGLPGLPRVGPASRARNVATAGAGGWATAGSCALGAAAGRAQPGRTSCEPAVERSSAG